MKQKVWCYTHCSEQEVVACFHAEPREGGPRTKEDVSGVYFVSTHCFPESPARLHERLIKTIISLYLITKNLTTKSERTEKFNANAHLIIYTDKGDKYHK